MMNTILIILTAITVALSMRVVGVLLIGALMVIPVVTAMRIARSFRQSILLSVGLAVLAVVIGLFMAYYGNLPAGGAIVLVALSLFAVVALFKRN
jgi:zinc transport system permease protein